MKVFQLSLYTVISCVCLCSAQTQDAAQIFNSDLLKTSIGDFSLLLMHHTARQIDDNIVTSPVTVWALMAALAEGASGKTLDQLLRHLRIRESERENTRYLYAELSKLLVANTSTVSFERSNALFADSSCLVKPGYAAILKEFYSTDVVPVNFKNTEPALELINDYVNKTTHGRINKVVRRGDLKDAKLIVTNAMFFKGQWTVPFNVLKTTLEPFYDINGKQIGEVNMMCRRAVYTYVNIPKLEVKIIQLPYGDQQRLSMLVFLPYPGVSLEKMFLNFKEVSLTDIFLKLGESEEENEGDEVKCCIPRFKITSDISMVTALNNMGIFDVFQPNYAELPKLSKENVYLSHVFHKAQIVVTEEGTAAVAVAVAGLGNRIAAFEYKANRPFAFFIADITTNLFVFAGVYSKPSVF